MTMDIENEKPVTKMCVWCIAVAVSIIPALLIVYFFLTGDAG